MTPDAQQAGIDAPSSRDAVAEQVAQALEPAARDPDPWWQAGLEEQLGQ